MFAASLASGVWLYVSLGRPVGAAALDTRGRAAVAVWPTCCSSDSSPCTIALLARAGAKARLARVVPPDSSAPTYVWVASLLFLLVVLPGSRCPALVYQVDGWGRWILYALQAAGVVLTVLAARRSIRAS